MVKKAKNVSNIWFVIVMLLVFFFRLYGAIASIALILIFVYRKDRNKAFRLFATIIITFVIIMVLAAILASFVSSYTQQILNTLPESIGS